jgi:hypothetical protein
MRQYIVPVAIVLGVSIIASVAYDRFAYDGSIDTAAFLTAESDPVWGAVSNTVTTGAAAGATASQPGHAHAASSVTNGAATWVDVAGDTMNGDLNLGGNDATNAYLSGAYVAPVQFHDVALATAAGTTTVTCVLSPTSVVHVVRIAATGSSVVVKFDMTAPTGRKQRCDGLLVVSNGNSRTIQWADTWYTATNGSYSTSATPVFGVRGEIGFWTMNGYWYRTLAVTNVPAASFAW